MSVKDRPRRFSGRQRVALYLSAGGRCENCGAELRPGWHADHWSPYAAGGATDVTNGQALCPRCNLAKGAKVAGNLAEWPDGLRLREWQEQAVSAFVKEDKRDFLLVATPGSGKTMAALRIAHRLLNTGRVERIVVVVPSDHLREQWAEKAFGVGDRATSFHRIGIQLDPRWRNGEFSEASDFHGVCVTYHSVASLPALYRRVCAQRRTLVILDEIHHAGDSLSWGRAVREAFEPAAYRLALSGTPFRSDNNTIPFVGYDGEGRSRGDFAYGYGQAIADGPCRPVLFPHYEGNMRWEADGEVRTARFADALSEEEASRRLRTALDPRGDWLPHVLREADADLLTLWTTTPPTHPKPAGIVFCKDQFHAKQVAQVLHRVAGSTPAVIISEDADASERLKAFDKSSAMWLVCVRMVSEGVDIPRLAVGVYATTVVTELFFRQAVGRVVRRIDEEDRQTAVFYIPKEETLVAYCQRIKDERDHAISVEEIARRARDWCEERDERRTPKLFAPLGAEAIPGGFSFAGQEFAPALAAEARRACDIGGLVPTAEHIAAFARYLARVGVVAPDAPRETAPAAAEPPAFKARQQARDAGNTKIKRFARILQDLTGDTTSEGRRLTFAVINREVAAIIGAKVQQMTEEQFLRRIRLVDEWITAANHAQSEGRGAEWARLWLGR